MKTIKAQPDDRDGTDDVVELMRQCLEKGPLVQLPEEQQTVDENQAIRAGYRAALEDVMKALQGDTTALKAAIAGSLSRDRVLSTPGKTCQDAAHGDRPPDHETPKSPVPSPESSPGGSVQIEKKHRPQLPGQSSGEKSPKKSAERRMTCYPTLTLPIRDLHNPILEGYVRDYSESGITISGIATEVGQKRSLLILWFAFGESYHFAFDTECVWVNQEDGGDCSAGFEVIDLPESEYSEFLDFMPSVALSELPEGEMAADFRSSMSEAQLMKKYDLTPEEFSSVFDQFYAVWAGTRQDSQPWRRRNAGARNEFQESYPVVLLPVYDIDTLGGAAFILNFAEKGIEIVGMETKEGERKSFLIQTDEFPLSTSFSFECECRSIRREELGKPAWFEITTISDSAAEELRKFIRALTLAMCHVGRRVRPRGKSAARPKREIRAKDLVDDIAAGLGNRMLMEKYKLTPKGLMSAFKKLKDARLLTPGKPASGDIPRSFDTVIHEQIRRMPRYRPAMKLAITDLDDLDLVCYVKDMTEKGVQVLGLKTEKGATKVFLIQAGFQTAVEPFSFTAVCRWAKVDPDNTSVAGFEITNISDADLKQLRKLMSTSSTWE